MKIRLYKCAGDDREKTLETLIEKQLPNIQTDTIHSIRQLSDILCRPLHGISAMVVFILCEKDIEQLITLTPLFDDIRVILILPDRTKPLMAQGLKLNPCFISYLDNDFTDIISVLNKLYQRAHGTGLQL
ncbi:MAG: hypothetical protein KKF12_18305 [Proteobacteria bacterium]|nr:hypothetical protein [Desulfobacula sp.]MBU3951630.1 hypothetical protein [Pseudomonadota bacterium]MBU4132774.1 hypothetical protein [Pseudomonadota bacterium]